MTAFRACARKKATLRGGLFERAAPLFCCRGKIPPVLFPENLINFG